MFLAVTIFCVVLGLVVRPAQEQKRAVEALRALGTIRIFYDYEVRTLSDGSFETIPEAEVSPPGPAWLRDLIGVDYFANVVQVDLNGPLPYLFRSYKPWGSENNLRPLMSLGKLESLNLSNSGITDREIDIIASLPRLRRLDLSCTDITGVELAKLSKAPELRELHIQGTNISSDGWVHLKKLTKLQVLDLTRPLLFDDGIRRPVIPRPVEYEGLVETADFRGRWIKITGAGLRHLDGMKSLRKLTFSFESLSDFQLKHLHRLTQLTELNLGATEITQAGFDALQAALPNCTIVGSRRIVIPQKDDSNLLESEDERIDGSSP